MIKALYTSITGMNAAQNALSVTQIILQMHKQLDIKAKGYF